MSLNMPTSSQALILLNKDFASRQNSRRYLQSANVTLQGCSEDRFTDYPHSHNDYPPDTSSFTQDDLKHLSRLSASVTGLSQIIVPTVRGYHGVLYYDPIAKAYRWQFGLSQNQAIKAKSESAVLPFYQPLQLKTTKGSLLILHTDAVRSTGDISALPSECKSSEKFQQQLVDLGFRPRFRKDNNAVVSQRKSCNPVKKNSCCIAGSNRKDVKEIVLLKSCETTEATTKASAPTRQEIQPKADKKNCLIRETEDKANSKTCADLLLENIQASIRKKDYKPPTIRMRKTLPDSRPCTVCFSCPDEFATHEKIKRLIESQTELSVRGLQFDLLSVNVGDPATKNRWLVTMESKMECDKLLATVVRFGDVIAKMRAYDDVAQEEHRAYKLHQYVENAKSRVSLLKQMEKKPKKKRKAKMKKKPAACVASVKSIPIF